MLVSVHCRGGTTVLQRRILRRQPKRIPPHRVQHVIPTHPHKPRQHIADRIIPHMPHMQHTARIRQHLQAIELRLPTRMRFRGIQPRIGIPHRLPPRLNLSGSVTLYPAINLHHIYGHPSIVNCPPAPYCGPLCLAIAFSAAFGGAGANGGRIVWSTSIAYPCGG